MTDEQKMPEKKKPGPKPKAEKPLTAENLLRLAERLSPEERQRLNDIGVNVPCGTEALEHPEDSIWGLRCGNCNQVALRFLGTKFGPNGEFDVPVPGTPLTRIPWTKDRGDPNNPNCQHCGAPPYLLAGGIRGHLAEQGKGVVLIKEHEEDLRQAFSRETKLRVKQEIAQMHSDANLGSQNFNSPSRRIEDHIAEATGDKSAGQVMEIIAEKSGLNQEAAAGRI